MTDSDSAALSADPALDEVQLDPETVGARIAQARRGRGLTQADLAQELGVARTTLVAIERGQRRVRVPELLQTAQILGRKISDLTRPLPESQPIDFAVYFRESRGRKRLPDADRAAAIEEFRDLCERYVELERLTGSRLPTFYPSMYDLSGTKPETAGEELAHRERRRLGLSDEPIRDLWRVLEADVGLRVFAPPLKGSIAGLFFYSADWGGCIAVNGNHTPGRQVWSAAHEYAHFLTDRDRADISVVSGGKLPAVERIADSFARNFLLPKADLVSQFQATSRGNNGTFTPADLITFADRYGVSFEAITLRLEDLGLLPSGTVDRLRGKGFKPTAARDAVGLPEHRGKRPILPLRYQVLAARAYSADKISEGQLAEYLRVEDRVAARERLAQLSLSEFGAEGWGQIAIPLGDDLSERAR